MELSDIQQKYDENLVYYNNLINLVSKKLSNIINIPIHSIKFRVKDFESFYSKISRKNYDNPFIQCTDLIGFRIICLFKSQKKDLIKLVKKEFDIIEMLDNKKKVDSFSYSSIHVIAKLKKNKSNLKLISTYSSKKKDSLKELNLPFEIQIRTILQDAWAEIEHNLNYKHIGIDEDDLRRINSVSALLEIADDQFKIINDNYLKQNREPVKSIEFTPELLYHYCKKNFSWAWKNPELFNVENIDEYNNLHRICLSKGINSIKKLNNLYEENKDDLDKYDKKHVKDVLNNPTQWPKLFNKVKLSKHFFSPVIILSMLIKELYK